jgi:hypothetical protein
MGLFDDEFDDFDFLDFNDLEKEFLQFLAKGGNSMSVWTPPGHKIKCEYLKSGMKEDKDHANQYLILGEIYTVKKVEVSNSISEVWLKEIPGTSFNTVHFSNVDKVNPKTEKELQNKWDKEADKDKLTVRKIQLVAREGVLYDILERDEFPTEGHKRVVKLIYEETLNEMKKLGLKPEE